MQTSNQEEPLFEPVHCPCCGSKQLKPYQSWMWIRCLFCQARVPARFAPRGIQEAFNRLAAHNPAFSAFDLTSHLRRQIWFSARTFGPGDRTEGVVDHIRKELNEVLADRQAGKPTLSEWVDVIILAFEGAWRSGATPAEIVGAMGAKQTKNEARTWPDWRPIPAGKAIEHDRSGEESRGKQVLP